MGGGAAMRAATKLTGISTFSGTFRSGGGSLVENPAAMTMKKVINPISATVSATDMKIEESVQRPAWELDDWEFASFENDHHQQQQQQQHGERLELFVKDKNGEAVNNYPRVVFGSVPTFEETKEATFELKEALDKAYLSSPKSSGSAESLSTLHETKACITHESSIPEGALQAFKLLKENPAAQTVVASIASDPNVWSAVMQNHTLMEFLESDRKYAYSETQEHLKSSLDVESEVQGSVNINDTGEPGQPDGFMGLIQDVKVTVIDMVSKLTSFVESLFSVPNVEKKGETYDSSKTFFAGGSFMALAIMVIMVVLMKRN